MNLHAVKRALSLLAAFLFMTFPGNQALAGPPNKALGLKIHEEKRLVRCVLRFEFPPDYSIFPSGAGKLVVVFFDTAPSPEFDEGLEKAGSLLKREASAAPHLQLVFTLPAPFLELSLARLEGKGSAGIYLEMPFSDSGSPYLGGEVSEAMVHQVNFGCMDGFTRVLVDLDQRVPWVLSHPRGDRIHLRFKSISAEPDTCRYGPAGNLAEAVLQGDGGNTDLAVRLLTVIDRIRMYWLESSSYLVADLYEGGPFSEEAPALSVSLNGGIADPMGMIPASGREGKSPETVGASPGPASPGRDRGDAPFFKGPIVMKEAHTGATEAPSPAVSVTANSGVKAAREKILEEMPPEAALHYGRILKAFDQGQYRKAADLCETFLRDFPGSPMSEEIAFLHADALYETVVKGDPSLFSSMIRNYQRTISKYRRSPKVQEAYLNMARASALVGNDYAAIGYLNILLNGAESPDVLRKARLERGLIYLKVNNPEKALEDFKNLLEKSASRESPLALMGVARYYLAVGLYDKAEEIMARIVDTNPSFHLDNPEFLFYRGQNALYRKKYDEARDFFFRALNIGGQPEGPGLLLTRIGDTYHHASRPREAERFYQTVIDEYPDSEGASIAKLRLAGYQTDTSGFEEIRKNNPNRPVGDLAILEMARKFFTENKFQKAMLTLKVLTDKPFKSGIVLEAENLYLRAAEEEIRRMHTHGETEALALFFQDHELELRGKIDPEVLLLAGLALHKREDCAQAISILEDIKPYDLGQKSKGQRVLTLMDCLLRSGREDQALVLLEKKEEREHLSAADRQKLDLQLVRMYIDKGKARAAFALFQGLVKQERLLPAKEFAAVYLDMGGVASRSGNHDQAKELLNRCVGLAETVEQDSVLLRRALAELGNAYFREAGYAKAIEYYNRALEKGFSPDDRGYWETRFLMAKAFLETGQYAQAEPMLVEISEQGDGLLQKRVRMRLGMLDLEKQLKRLSNWPGGAH